jgi:hypothetical protein
MSNESERTQRLFFINAGADARADCALSIERRFERGGTAATSGVGPVASMGRVVKALDEQINELKTRQVAPLSARAHRSRFESGDVV